MLNLTYPGVYIQEVPSGVRTITGVSTSIAAFFGRASMGPIDRAVRLTSPADYERTFGAPHPKSDLAQSVQMFFANGGTKAYIVPVGDGNGVAAAASLVDPNDATKAFYFQAGSYSAKVDYTFGISDVDMRLRLGVNNLTDERAPIADEPYGFFKDAHRDWGRNYYLDLKVSF